MPAYGPNKEHCDIQADLIFKELAELLQAKRILIRQEWLEDRGGREHFEAQQAALHVAKEALKQVVWADAQFSF